MERKLHLVQHLYGEAASSEELEKLLQDSDLRREYAEFSNLKHLLDSGVARTRNRAPGAAVNRIMEHAARGRHSFGHGPARRLRRIAVWGGASIAAAAMLLILIWSDDPPETPLESPEVTAMPPAAPLSEPDLPWDDIHELMEVRRSISVVRQRTSPQL